jgi:hypothetical protein
MKIKIEKEMNLPELIQWAWDLYIFRALPLYQMSFSRLANLEQYARESNKRHLLQNT